MPATFSQEGVARRCRDDELTAVLSIVNSAAVAYRGVIPDDCWHEPYMTRSALLAEIAAGVDFQGWEESGQLAGVMGLQNVRDATLIRHAYVRPGRQGGGIGGALLETLTGQAGGQLLVGTWAAAHWAIRFYERQGFRLVDADEKTRLLRTYWTIPARQEAVSVVLVRPR